MLKKAQDKNLLEISIHNLRNWSTDTHKTVDSRPYGGGMGMVLRVDVVHRAITKLQNTNSKQSRNTKKIKSKTILLTPGGEMFNQEKAKQFSELEHIILIAGHYEGFDQRIHEHLVDVELSIGKYVLTGGEIPAMVVVDSVARLIPGVLTEEAKSNESFYDGETIDYPQYTRPENYKDWKVPEILLSGDHKKITDWRAKQSRTLTDFKKKE